MPAIDREYHAGLPDMLWLSDARDITEREHELTRLFTHAARSRAAKRTNDHFLQIATAIVSIEVLAPRFLWLGQALSGRQEGGRIGS